MSSTKQIYGKLNLITTPTVDNINNYDIIIRDPNTGELKMRSLSNIIINTGNILYVASTGSDTDLTRAGHIGNIAKPFLTLESASIAALPGDLIYVFNGTYTVTTTATNGLAKDGVNWYFEAGAVVNKATAGDMFNDTGFTVGCNIYGKGNFNKTGSAGSIVNYTQNIDWTFEYNYISNSAVGNCILNSGSSFTPTNTVIIKGKSAIATGGECMLMKSFKYINIDGGNLIRSTSSYGINFVNPVFATALIQKGIINCTTIESTVSNTAGIQILSINTFTFNVAYCNYLQTANSAVEGMTFNGNLDLLYCGNNESFSSPFTRSVTINGNVKQFTGSEEGNIFIQSCQYVNCTSTMSATVIIGNLLNNSNITNHNFGGTGTYIVQRYSSSQWFLKPSTGRVIFKGKVTGGSNFATQILTVSGGSLTFEQGFSYDDSISVAAGTINPAILMTGGTVEIWGTGINNASTNDSPPTLHGATCVMHRGGKLILRNCTLKTSNNETPVIIADTAPQNIYVQNTLSSNRTENGGTLAAKKQKHLVTCTATSPNTIVLNDGSGGNETFTNSGGSAIANATALTGLINASGTLDITAVDNGNGTFTIESDVAGTPFTIVSQTNVSNVVVRLNSYAITNITGGTIIENANVE